MLKIMFSAGEPSGDLHGASLAKAVLEKCPDAELIGFGGPQMADAGVRLCADMREYSVMGVWEVIKNIRRIFLLLNRLCDFMRSEKPDLLVLIDYPDFNWRLAAKAKAMGIPVFSYIPPSAWAWRKGRARKCAAVADELVAIFPFELPVYEAAGANISFCGNPMLDTVKASMSADEAKKYFSVSPEAVPVLLLPGSRRQEIAKLLPPMLDGAKLLQEDNPQLEFYLPVAPGISQDFLEEFAGDCGVVIHYTRDHTYDLMNICQFAIATSGTVVLEAAIMGLPCVALYRMAPLNYAIGKLLVDIDYFTLPNILAGKEVQKELLQDEVTGAEIFRQARKYYASPDYRNMVIDGLAAAVKQLGEPGAASRVAERIIAAARDNGAELEVNQ
ncbi:MAG: lipid-A-disaccharide synthase [Anaerovibrio sp.]|uniref:lipid-A-disaccharide synthase n=1 Tax=Anaerovibrio sp. TaxID=1872532 RepID=UPI0025DE1D0A|nr:lipid-A-disaccharide synthase [Anaerovibrio sp.]MCR5176186.1 lipid-A-disaccharide synthase [Anaerovibrio sp.]